MNGSSLEVLYSTICQVSFPVFLPLLVRFDKLEVNKQFHSCTEQRSLDGVGVSTCYSDGNGQGKVKQKITGNRLIPDPSSLSSEHTATAGRKRKGTILSDQLMC